MLISAVSGKEWVNDTISLASYLLEENGYIPSIISPENEGHQYRTNLQSQKNWQLYIFKNQNESKVKNYPNSNRIQDSLDFYKEKDYPEVYKHVPIFDFLICTDNYADSSLFHNLKKESVIITNNDVPAADILYRQHKHKILTCGLHPKSSITLSSFEGIKDNGVVCCVQRKIYALNGRVIEPQEFVVKNIPEKSTCYGILSSLSLMIASGILP